MMTAEPTHQQAFAFLRTSRSISTSTRATAGTISIPVIKKYPELLGIGLSEGTGIIVTRRSVRGDGQVEGRDPRQHAALSAVGEAVLLPVVAQGDVYNMKTRKVEKYGKRRSTGAAAGAERI